MVRGVDFHGFDHDCQHFGAHDEMQNFMCLDMIGMSSNSGEDGQGQLADGVVFEGSYNQSRGLVLPIPLML